jgi:hypothetical protein
VCQARLAEWELCAIALLARSGCFLLEFFSGRRNRLGRSFPPALAGNLSFFVSLQGKVRVRLFGRKLGYRISKHSSIHTPSPVKVFAFHGCCIASKINSTAARFFFGSSLLIHSSTVKLSCPPCERVLDFLPFSPATLATLDFFLSSAHISNISAHQ